VQVGAFAESEPAEQLAGTLRDKGFATSISPGADSRSARWRVRVGPVATREEADRLAARLKSEQGLPTWVRGADGD
jgi:DedD protein